MVSELDWQCRVYTSACFVIAWIIYGDRGARPCTAIASYHISEIAGMHELAANGIIVILNFKYPTKLVITSGTCIQRSFARIKQLDSN